MTQVRSAARCLLSACGGLLALCAARPAAAYCREVAATMPAGYNPADAGCFTSDYEAGVLPPLFWRNQYVNYNLNRAASKYITLSQARQAATLAFAQWATAVCPDSGGSPSILATEGPTVDCDDQSEGHNNPIIFRDTGWTHTDSANAIGYTTLTVELDTGEILGAEIEINTENQVIVPTPEPDASDAHDLQSILTHEAGHFLGLAHSADSTAVMYAFYHAGSTTLQPDDVNGICSIYSPDGSRNTLNGPISGGANSPAPILGFEDFCGSVDASALSSVVVPGETSSDGGLIPTETLLGCAMAGPARGVGGPALGSGAASAAMPAIISLGLFVRRRRSRTA
jgi:predicted Zn-dependent protease